MNTRTRALGVAAAACALLAGGPASASAEPTIAELRVEGKDGVLDAGTHYVNDSATLRTAPGQCAGSGDPKTVNRPSAIGIVEHAKRANERLAPYYVSDRFSFGLIVCRIGDSGAFDANEAWLYRVNHRAAEVGAEQFPLSRGDEVLWYFANFGTGENTGDELELRGPARARPGQPFRVRAVSYDSNGTEQPAAGVSISGDSEAVTGPDGSALVTVAQPEEAAYLRGTRGNDIPAAPVRVCVDSNLAECPGQRPERIFGTHGDDLIRGTAAPNIIDARNGDDRINVRESGSDSVRCGPGEDSVSAYRNDRIAADCERVNGRLRD